MRTRRKPRRWRVTRRDFIRYSTAAVAGAGAARLLGGCGSGSAGRAPSDTGSRTLENRTYLFNLTHIDAAGCDLYLVAGSRAFPLEPTSADTFREAAGKHPFLETIGLENVPFCVKGISLPKDRLQLCHVTQVDRTTGTCTTPFIFMHFPKRKSAGPSIPKRLKWKRYGIDTSGMPAVLFDDVLVDTFDMASTLIGSFPDILSLDPATAQSVSTDVIANNDSTSDLADSLASQGGRWAASVPIIDPDTGTPPLNSQGLPCTMTRWSATTNRYAGPAINQAVQQVMNDPAYGMNTTDVQPDDDMPAGKLRTYHEGVTCRNATGGIGDELPGSTFTYTAATNSGYKYDVQDMGVDADRNISYTIRNSALRFLSPGVAYKDPSGNLLTYGQIGASFFDNPVFASQSYSQDQTDFVLGGICGPELTAFAIPVKSTTLELTVPTPAAAETIALISGGLGNSSDLGMSHVSSAGTAVTLVMCFAIPMMCMAMDAADAYKGILSSITERMDLIELIIQGVSQIVVGITYHDADAIWDALVQIGEWLVSTQAVKLYAWIGVQIGSWAVFDSFPIVGQIAEAVAAAADAAAMGETAAEVANSPTLYETDVVVTHTITLVMLPDPLDTSGFPSTATHYDVALHLSNAIPVYSADIPIADTRVPSLTQVFDDVPVGGTVSIAVSFYGGDGCLVGKMSLTGDNSSPEDLSFTEAITELLHPLTPQTTYDHKEKITLDGSGNHVWTETNTPPAETGITGCAMAAGQICTYGEMTVSNPYAGIGYSWMGYDTAAGSQQWQFANVSIGTSTPQASYVVSPGSLPRVGVAYSLMGDGDTSFYADPSGYIRQVRLTLDGATTYDGASSNRAWGKLQLPSDDLLYHPEGKIISISADYSKIEVLILPAKAGTDAYYSSNVTSTAHAGKGSQPGLLDTPRYCAMTPRGEILILEVANNRVSSFDPAANPVPTFGPKTYWFPLKDPAGTVTYLDIAVENKGFVYVLSKNAAAINLDVYSPTGEWVFRTSGVNAARLCVTLWRDVYTLNYEPQTLPGALFPALAEPTISHWIPYGGCGSSSARVPTRAAGMSARKGGFFFRIRKTSGV